MSRIFNAMKISILAISLNILIDNRNLTSLEEPSYAPCAKM
jgi:hypothetical protein